MDLSKMNVISEDKAPKRYGSGAPANYQAVLSKCADLERGQVLQIPGCNTAQRTKIDELIRKAYKNLKFDVWGRTVDGDYRIYVMLRDE